MPIASTLRALIAASAIATLSPVAAFAQSTAVMAVASTFTTMDPYDANDTLSQAACKSFYQGLYGFDKDMKIHPVLATGYEASTDAKVYTIHLRQGVKFQDGTDFN